MDPVTRNLMESRFRRDFSSVRVHEGTDAATSAKAVHALAYTVGHHVVFGEGRYRPRSPEGLRLLAHELTHVGQQARGGQVGLQRQPDDVAEAAEEETRRFRRARRSELGRIVEGLRFRKVIRDCPDRSGVRLTDVLASTAARIRGNRACLGFFRRRFNIDPLPLFSPHRDPTFTVVPRMRVSGQTRCPPPSIRIRADVCTSPLRERVIAHEITHYAGCLTSARAPTSERVAEWGEDTCIGTVREVLERHRAAEQEQSGTSGTSAAPTSARQRMDRFPDPMHGSTASPADTDAREERAMAVGGSTDSSGSPIILGPTSGRLEAEAERMASDVVAIPEERGTANSVTPPDVSPAPASTLQRRLEVADPASPAAYLPPPDDARPRAQLVQGWLRTLCPAGRWNVDRSSGAVTPGPSSEVCATERAALPGAATATPVSCACLCHATAATTRSIRVLVAESLTYDYFTFDRSAGIFRLRPDTHTARSSGEGFTVFPEDGAWLDATTVVLSGRRTTVAGAGETGGRRARRISDPPWIILGHEICGHIGVREARGSEGYDHVETPTGDRSAVDIENRIRREHSTARRSLGVRSGDTGGIRGGLYVLGAGESFDNVSRRLGMPTGPAAFDAEGYHRRILHWPSGDRVQRSDFTALFVDGTELFIEGIHWHEVIAGETWTSIARIYAVRAASIRRANPGVTLRRGARLLIPVA